MAFTLGERDTALTTGLRLSGKGLAYAKPLERLLHEVTEGEIHNRWRAISHVKGQG